MKTTRGRPRSSTDGGERKPRRIRLTDDEWRWIATQANTAGLAIAEWIRRKALRGYKH